MPKGSNEKNKRKKRKIGQNPNQDNATSAIQLANTVANDRYAADINPPSIPETLRTEVLWVLMSLGLSGCNAWFYMSKSIEWAEAQSPNPNTPEARTETITYTLSTVLSNFVGALYGCMLLFNELRKPYGSRNHFIIAFGIGCLSAIPSLFTYALGATGSPALVYSVGTLVALGNVPTQSLGVLRFLKGIWSYLKAVILEGPLGNVFANRELFRAQNKLVDRFLKQVGDAIDSKIRASEPIDFGQALLDQLLALPEQQAVVVPMGLPLQISPSLGERLGSVLHTILGYGIGTSGALIVLAAGALTAVPSTFFGFRDPLLHLTGSPIASNFLSVFVTFIATAPSVLRTSIFGFTFGKDTVFGTMTAMLSYLLRSIKQREFKPPHFPLWFELAKVGSVAGMLLAGFMVSRSYATGMRLLGLVYGTQPDPSHPNKIMLPPALFNFFATMVPPAAIILNITGASTVFYAAMLNLTNALLSVFNGRERARNSNHAILQAWLQVLKETPIPDLAKELASTFDVGKLVQMTGLPQDEVEELKKIQDCACIESEILTAKQALEHTQAELELYGGPCFWSKPQDGKYDRLYEARGTLKKKIEILENQLERYPHGAHQPEEVQPLLQPVDVADGRVNRPIN